VLRLEALDSGEFRPDNPNDWPAVVVQVVPSPGISVPGVAVALLNRGLRPGEESSVAPSGIPVGVTGAPGVMLSGDVAATPGVGIVVALI